MSDASCPKYLFPAIDLRDGKVVRLVEGDYDRQTTYGDDPLAVAQSYEAAGCTWLHLVDLDGARDGTMRHLSAITEICRQTQLKVEVGGGVRDELAMDRLLQVGVNRVVLGTAALKRWEWFGSLMGNPTYRGRLVLGLDAKDGHAASDGWEQTSDRSALGIAREVRTWPLSAIVYTDIATDGTLKGPNVEATDEMARATDVPVVASGGVGRLDHLRALRELPIQGAIVGRALYDGRFTVEEARRVFEEGA